MAKRNAPRTTRRARQARKEAMQVIAVSLGALVALPVIASAAMLYAAAMANNQYTATVWHDIPAAWMHVINFVF